MRKARIKFIITPDHLTVLNKNGNEFTTNITHEQYSVLVEQGLFAIDIGLDRFIWEEPMLGFSQAVSEIISSSRNPAFHHWLLYA